MAQQLTLEAEKRESTGSAEVRRLRKQGVVPAIVYGGKQRNYPIQVNAKRIGDILKESASEQILVTLQIEGAEEKEKLALIQDVQHDHLSGQILHIDFNAVQEDQEIHASIPIELDGDPAGVKQGGVLEQLLRELPISCLPKHLPELIHIDVSGLNVGDGIHINEMELPEGVTAQMAGEILVASVAESRATKSGEAGEEEAAEGASAGDEAAKEGGEG